MFLWNFSKSSSSSNLVLSLSLCLFSYTFSLLVHCLLIALLIKYNRSTIYLTLKYMPGMRRQHKLRCKWTISLPLNLTETQINSYSCGPNSSWWTSLPFVMNSYMSNNVDLCISYSLIYPLNISFYSTFEDYKSTKCCLIKIKIHMALFALSHFNMKCPNTRGIFFFHWENLVNNFFFFNSWLLDSREVYLSMWASKTLQYP